MMIHQVWSSCAIVLAAMSMVSCAEGQFGQVMQTVGKSMAKGMCAEGNGPSSMAPEFCLYVTEVRLLNHDSDADVSLTIVNRTGRRLYLTVPSWPYLTDSSGVKWDMTKNTGIVWTGYGAPLALEPNVESQVAFLFHRTGQAPLNVNFSMRGEISIAKVDSRGEPVPGQPQVTRGFNFSRLSLEPQQPVQRLQGSAPASQSTSTQLASSNAQENVSAGVSTNNSTNTRAVSSLGGAASGSPSVPAGVWGELDVQGVRIGATYEDVLKVLSAYKLKATRESPKEHRIKLQQIPDMPFLSSITGTFSTTGQMGSKNSEMQNFVAEFSPPPMKHEVSVVIINRSFWQDRPTMEATREALEEKYGPPSFKETADHREGWVWLYDASGAKSVSSSLKGQCSFNTVFHQGEPEYSININRNFDAVIGKCGRMLAVDMSYIPDGKDLLGNLKTALVDGPLILKAAEATRSLIAEREKDDRNNRIKAAEKVGKPSL